MWFPWWLALLIGLPGMHTSRPDHSPDNTEGTLDLGTVIGNITSVLRGIASDDAAESHAAWSRIKADPDYRILQDASANDYLCIVLSQVPKDVRENGRVQLLLSGLPLYQDPQRQIACIVSAVGILPAHCEGFSTFIGELPVVTDPRLWHHVLWAYPRLGALQQRALLDKCPALANSSREPDMLAQLCAYKREPFAGLDDLLPVYTDLEGMAISEDPAQDAKCQDMLTHPRSSVLAQLVADTKLSLGTIPESAQGTLDMDLALRNGMSAEEFKGRIKGGIVAGGTGGLLKLVDYSDQLVRRISPEDALAIAAILTAPIVPPEVFVLFFERAGAVVDKAHRRSFIWEALRSARQYNPRIYYKWHIELTLLDPTVAGIGPVGLPFLDAPVAGIGPVGLPLWDRLLQSGSGAASLATLLPSLRGAAEEYLLELVLAKSRCLTSQPVVEPARCGELLGLIQELRLPLLESLEGGYWRLASVSLHTKAQLVDYLQEAGPSIAVMAWILSVLDQRNDVHSELLKSLSVLIRDKPVRIFLALYDTIRSAERRDICRPAGEPPLSISPTLLGRLLDRRRDGVYCLQPWERFQIARSLLSAMTGVHPDAFGHVLTGSEPAGELVNGLVRTYCSPHANHEPGLFVLPHELSDNRRIYV